MLDILHNVPSVQLAIYCSVFFVGITWLGLVFVKPFLRAFMARQPRINELVAHTTSGFSLFYGLLLGLLAVAAYQNYDEVKRNVFNEAASLATLYRDISHYPQPVRSVVQELLRDYTQYVIHKDWPGHREGKIYAGGGNRMSVIQHEILGFEPTTISYEVLHAQTLSDFKETLNARQRRLVGVEAAIPGVLWYAVAIGALINIVLIWMLDIRFFTHTLLSGIVSFFLGVMIFVLISMDNPLKGEVSVKPDLYQLLYDRLMVWDEDG